MGLVGALSNHDLRAPLTRLARAPARLPARRARLPTPAYRRSRPGTVLNAVAAVLAAADRPMSPRHVHAEAEVLLGAPVLWGSVKQALSGNTTGKGAGRACFERVRRGLYRLYRP